ncbi:hypothetical protein ANACAC_01960 [Anaerostipes caccae L1-92]|uniref:Uncharacterized protein n=1 Tax=Anaerostipes caccae (strain DSM 14662 / CCUG 47493 / JCM 13470 / NCIMB 13811 / L1-92) TaxID=411490 RepID=B0MEG4_ANACD|nr:hypothetical protein ANACAC_01960 [Anaerostipes caccae L1-92]
MAVNCKVYPWMSLFFFDIESFFYILPIKSNYCKFYFQNSNLKFIFRI